jgi:hypothetical protein
VNEENSQQFGQRQEEGLGTALVARGGELAIAASAAAAKAEVEAGFLVAMKVGRDWDQARQDILRACNNPIFAEKAIGKRPVGGGKMWRELTIRFTEVALQAAKHMRVNTSAVYGDEMTVTYRTSITDLVNNQTYSEEFRLDKTVERSGKEGRNVVGERKNSKGYTTYIVVATEDEMQNKIAARNSKLIRSLGNRLIPEWIKDEAKELCQQAKLRSANDDPEAYRKKLADSFAGVGVTAAMLKSYLGHDLASVQPVELAELREIYEEIRDGNTRWSEVIADKQRVGDADGGLKTTNGRMSFSDAKATKPPIDVTPADEPEPPTTEEPEPKREPAEPEPPKDSKVVAGLKKLFAERGKLYDWKSADKKDASEEALKAAGISSWSEITLPEHEAKMLEWLDACFPVEKDGDK